jgi:hypothetical protein
VRAAESGQILSILILPLSAPPPDGAKFGRRRMARELGMNPKKLGKLDNDDQEPWKAPLPEFIEHLYLKSFGRERPQVVTSIEERARAHNAKKAARKEARRQARAAGNERPPEDAR